jgi:hypothetical protein
MWRQVAPQAAASEDHRVDLPQRFLRHQSKSVRPFVALGHPLRFRPNQRLLRTVGRTASALQRKTTATVTA